MFLHIQRECMNTYDFHFQFPRLESQPAETRATRTFFFLSSLCSFSVRLVVLWLSLSLVICGCHWMSLVFIGCHSFPIVVTGCRFFSLIVNIKSHLCQSPRLFLNFWELFLDKECDPPVWYMVSFKLNDIQYLCI